MRWQGLLATVVAVVVGTCGFAYGQHPIAVEAGFNGICPAYFTPLIEPEMYRMFGDDLRLIDDGTWRHVSEISAAVAWETNLPAKGYIHYGPNPGYYIYVTPITLRNTFLHLHYLRNLNSNSTYYYQTISIDEKGRVARSDEKSFTTKAPAKMVRIPEGVVGEPPYMLDKADTTYVVTKDLTCPSTAFNITADGVTLDLGGNTVIYNAKAGAPDPGGSAQLYGPFASPNPCGIRSAAGKAGVRVVNGTIKQGDGMGTARPAGYTPIYLYKAQAPEIAGVKVDYAGSQVNGIIVRDATDGAVVHHNVVNDRGTELYNRHIAVDAIAFDVASTVKGLARCHNNLVLRTRQRGIKCSPKNEIYANEIYIDSYATASYGIFYEATNASTLSIHHNKVFGTGFHPIGIGSGQGWSDVKVFSNYVHMFGTTELWRWRGGEGGGDKAAADKTGIYPVNGIRLSKPRENVAHYDNVVVIKGAGPKSWMRGVWISAYPTMGKNIVFQRNRIKMDALDPYADGWAVAADGTGTLAADPVVELDGNVIMTNLVNVQLGDNNGPGGPYRFVRNAFIKTGYDTRYRTIGMGWQGMTQQTWGHEFIDNRMEGGASYDKVKFDVAGAGRFEFNIMWDVEVRTAAGATVSIKSDQGGRIYRGTADGNGKVTLTLTQTVVTATKRTERTPHVIEVTKGAKKASKSVIVDRSQTVVIDL